MASTDWTPIFVGGLIGVTGSAIVAAIAQVTQYRMNKSNHAHDLEKMRLERQLDDQKASKERRRDNYVHVLRAALNLREATRDLQVTYAGETHEEQRQRIGSTLADRLKDIDLYVVELMLEDAGAEITDLYKDLHGDFAGFIAGLDMLRQGITGVDINRYAQAIDQKLTTLMQLMRQRLGISSEEIAQLSQPAPET